jgi:signal transduction histidine kinase
MKKIMIIDDLKENLSVLDKTLSNIGYDIRVFMNPLDALKEIKNTLPDLILLDINMPQMSGLELCKEIKKEIISKDVPIIFLTAQDDKETKIRAFSSGGVDYITKPFVIEELCARVETHLKISGLQKDLENMNIMLEDKVKERTEQLINELEAKRVVEKKLKAALIEAEEANKAKNMFLSNMSHELRTPMNGIIGMTEILKESNLSEELQIMIEYQSEAEETLLRIIENLFNIEKLESGNIEKKNEEINIKDIIKTNVLKNDLYASKKGLKILHSYNETIPETLYGDGEKIEDVLQNLLSNAIKFTESGEIKVEIKKLFESDEFIETEISVEDTGVGIAEEERDNLFKMFTQGDISYTKVYQGMGLGLVIAEKLVESMNGEIGYESEKGKGSRFYFKIKLAKA